MNTKKPEDVVAVPKIPLFDVIIDLYFFWEDTDPGDGVELDFPVDDGLDLNAATEPVDTLPDPHEDYPRQSPLLQYVHHTQDFYAACGDYIATMLCDLTTPLFKDEILLEEFYDYAEEVRHVTHIDLSTFEAPPSPAAPKPARTHLSVVKDPPKKE